MRGLIEVFSLAVCAAAGVVTVGVFVIEVRRAFRENRSWRKDLELAAESLERTIGAVDETRHRLRRGESAAVHEESAPGTELDPPLAPLGTSPDGREDEQRSKLASGSLLARRAALLIGWRARALVQSDTWLLASIASLVSVLAWIYFSNRGDVLAYKDAVSHMEIARRIIDSPTTGFGQLGGVWLPMPHLLMLPFIWIDPLYYSGLAGSLVSMASYVVTSVLLYKILLDLTGSRLPAWVGALAFMVNPNVLYMQSTPMTELLLFACMAAMVYLVQRWIATDNYVYLLGSGAAAFVGTLTRYEAWILFAVLTGVVFLTTWRKGYGRVKVEGVMLGFLFVAGLGIVGWLGWDQLIFGNALYFQDGKYAKPSLWVGASDIAVGHWVIAAKTYWFAVVDNLSSVGVYVAIAGLVALVARTRLNLRTLPVLSLMVMVPFFVLALEAGQRPLHVLQVNGDLYNVRFGLIMALPAAIFVGYLADASLSILRLRMAPVVAIALLALGTATMMRLSEIATLREAVTGQHDTYTQRLDAAAVYLKKHPAHGMILMEQYGNDSLLLRARIPLKNNIYEGSYRLWGPALKDPQLYDIQEIVMRHSDPPDEVYRDLFKSAALRDYRLSYKNDGYYIFTSKT